VFGIGVIKKNLDSFDICAGLGLTNTTAWPGLAELEPENFLMGWTLASDDSGGLASSCVKLRLDMAWP
jgi:hypothetical protein